MDYYSLYQVGTYRLSLLYILGRSTVLGTEDQAGLLRSPVTRSRATACGMCGLRRGGVSVCHTSERLGKHGGMPVR